MSLIDLIAVGIFCCVSGFAGSFVYDKTGSLGMAVVAGVLAMYAFTIMQVCLAWLSDRFGRARGCGPRKPTFHRSPPERTAARRADQVQTLSVLGVTIVAVLIGQLVYAGSRDRAKLVATTFAAFVVCSVVVGSIGRAMSRSKRR